QVGRVSALFALSNADERFGQVGSGQAAGVLPGRLTLALPLKEPEGWDRLGHDGFLECQSSRRSSRMRRLSRCKLSLLCFTSLLTTAWRRTLASFSSALASVAR